MLLPIIFDIINCAEILPERNTYKKKK